MDLQALAPGALILGKLRIVRQLGQGGMGAVYEVEHTLTRHHRALKLLLAGADADPELVERFLREASAAGRIGSAHVVETFDAGTLPSGEPYIVMELLEGESLGSRLARGRLTEDESIDVLLQALEGIGAAHRAGIVHRDIKPDNLFLVGGPPPVVKVVDFGISKFDPVRTDETGLTGDGRLLGTPLYMAPEQIEGSAAVDERTDLYALGVVFYECLTGQRPFEAQNLGALAIKIHAGAPTWPSQLAGVGAAVDAVVARAMATRPEDRYRSAEEMAAAVLGLRERLRLGHAKTAASTPPEGPAAEPEGRGEAAAALALPSAPGPSGGGARRASMAIGVVAVVTAAALLLVDGGQPAEGVAESAEPSRSVAPPPRREAPAPSARGVDASAPRQAPAPSRQPVAADPVAPSTASWGSPRGTSRSEQHRLPPNPY